MNYRQWKKNYKKKHGCNPPLEVDKRKQAELQEDLRLLEKRLQMLEIVWR